MPGNTESTSQSSTQSTVTFRFVQKGLLPIVVPVQVGRSLLELALEHDINLNHNCGAVCACSTCHVYIDSGADTLEEMTDKEEDFVDRANNPRITSRLSCQCEILKDGTDIVCTVPDQSGILGH